MDPPSAFRFPARDGQPLQTLPAERVNGTRPVSSITTTTTSTRKTFETDSEQELVIQQLSPSRKAKASLFADPTTPTSKVSGFALPQSPSLPEINALRQHVRTNSDVQGLVKRFEHLDVRDRDAESVERKRRHEAELRRAQIAREEAESDVRRLREEVRRLKKEGDDSRDRERRVAKRLEVVMVSTNLRDFVPEARELITIQEEFGNSKEARDSEHVVYEKELRKARKEAFKSSSAVLKLQEELKSTRSTLRITQSGLDLERQKLQRKEQERFEMEYQLIPVQEELEKLKHRLRVAEEEREALKTNLREEEVARIAAEGMIALPASQDMDVDLLSSPRKQPSPQKIRAFDGPDEDKENVRSIPKKSLETKRLAEELAFEKSRRLHAEDMAEFLRAECMFNCCGCKTAARLGHDFALELDEELAAGVERIRVGMEEILKAPIDLTEQEDLEVEVFSTPSGKYEAVDVEIVEVEMDEPKSLPVDDVVVEEVERSMTFQADSPARQQPADEQLEQGLEESPPPQQAEECLAVEATETTVSIPTRPETPPGHQHHLQSTPFRQQPSIRTVTTTTTVPMHFTPVANPLPAVFDSEDTENVPPTPRSAILPDGSELPTFDRAAALAAIAYRRGRAKSIANGQATPRKQMMEGVKERRDISAPALSQNAPVSAGRPAASVKRAR
jgi:hypothetical protein